MTERLLSVVLIYLLHSPTQALPAAKLFVKKKLITDTDSVRLRCQRPSYPKVYRCYFVFVNTKKPVESLCTTTMTGSELLLRSQQIPPAVVQVECFYAVKYGDVNSPSKHSDISSIAVQRKSLGGPFNTRTTAGVPQTSPRSVASTFGAPASATGRWMVAVVIALASVGVTVGVILLGLTLRRTVSERIRRSGHENTEVDGTPVIEDEYVYIYSTMTNDLAPQFKENELYSSI